MEDPNQQQTPINVAQDMATDHTQQAMMDAAGALGKAQEANPADVLGFQMPELPESSVTAGSLARKFEPKTKMDQALMILAGEPIGPTLSGYVGFGAKTAINHIFRGNETDPADVQSERLKAAHSMNEGLQQSDQLPGLDQILGMIQSMRQEINSNPVRPPSDYAEMRRQYYERLQQKLKPPPHAGWDDADPNRKKFALAYAIGQMLKGGGNLGDKIGDAAITLERPVDAAQTRMNKEYDTYLANEQIARQTAGMQLQDVTRQEGYDQNRFAQESAQHQRQIAALDSAQFDAMLKNSEYVAKQGLQSLQPDELQLLKAGTGADSNNDRDSKIASIGTLVQKLEGRGRPDLAAPYRTMAAVLMQSPQSSFEDKREVDIWAIKDSQRVKWASVKIDQDKLTQDQAQFDANQKLLRAKLGAELAIAKQASEDRRSAIGASVENSKRAATTRIRVAQSGRSKKGFTDALNLLGKQTGLLRDTVKSYESAISDLQRQRSDHFYKGKARDKDKVAEIDDQIDTLRHSRDAAQSSLRDMESKYDDVMKLIEDMDDTEPDTGGDGGG